MDGTSSIRERREPLTVHTSYPPLLPHFVRYLAERCPAAGIVAADSEQAAVLRRVCPDRDVLSAGEWDKDNLTLAGSEERGWIFADLDSRADLDATKRSGPRELLNFCSAGVLAFRGDAQRNPRTVRRVLGEAGVEAVFTGFTDARGGLSSRMVVAVVNGRRQGIEFSEATNVPSDFRVIAFMPVFNEADVIQPALAHLFSQGVEVYVIDNWSTDGSYELAREYLGRGLAGIERFPAEGPSEYYQWRRILARVEELASQTSGDWFILQDADEIRQAPWPSPLRQALFIADKSGFNAVDHTVLLFPPVDDGFRQGIDLQDYFRHFCFDTSPNQFVEVKAWKNLKVPVRLSATGGHEAQFEGRRVFPYKFLLKHYPIRSQRHGEKKVFEERRNRWDPEEKALGWHVHYDSVAPGHAFVRPVETLKEYDPEAFDEDYLLERLSGIGIPKEYSPTETVSIIVVNYNGAEHLTPCLQSLRQLDYGPSLIDITVVDNLSTDSSLQLLAQDFPEVRVVRSPRNEGFARAANRGAAAVTGKYLVFLNNDMEVDRQWLSALVDEQLSDQSLGCVGSVVLNWEGTKVQFSGRREDWFCLDWRPGQSNQSFRHLPPRAFVPFVSGGAMLVRRDVFHAIGDFDPDCFFYHEDVDFGWRTCLAGYRCLITSRSIVWHRGGATAAKADPIALASMGMWHTLQSAYINAGTEIFSDLISRAIGALVTRLQYSELDRAALPGMMEAIVKAGDSLKKKRAAVQASRKVTDSDIFLSCGRPFGFTESEAPEGIVETVRQVVASRMGSKDERPDALLLTALAVGLCAYSDFISGCQAELQQRVEERDRIITELQAEVHQKVGECNCIISELQAELHAKVGERDQSIVGLQAELHQKVQERDDAIRGLQATLVEKEHVLSEAQAELHRKVGECNRIISELQAELHAKVGERDRTIISLQAELHQKVQERDDTIRALQATLVEKEHVLSEAQAELHRKVGECNRTIGELQAELHAKAGEHDQTIQDPRGGLD